MSTYLLVWDAPNMDMGLGSLLGGRPTAAHRPRFDAIGRWLVHLAQDVDAEPRADVFTNVTPGGADVIRPWVEAIRNVGFGVFAKPKIHEDDDVDPDMLDHIESLPVTVLGFHEHAAWAVGHADINFVDLEDIEGVFREPLPRVNLDNLPEGGAWLQPFRPLAALLNNR